jgi:hypothetical protein
MEIISGLNRGPVARLEKTFAALDAKSKKKLASLQELTNHEKSYKAIREYLLTIDPPCIPYLGTLLLPHLSFTHTHTHTHTHYHTITLSHYHTLSHTITHTLHKQLTQVTLFHSTHLTQTHKEIDCLIVD